MSPAYIQSKYDAKMKQIRGANEEMKTQQF